MDAEGKVLEGATTGNLCIADSWPGQMRTVYGDHQRFVDTYFKTYPGKYFTGDGCRRDEDGYYWITGRVDDVINVVRPPARHRGSGKRAGRASESLGSRRGRLSARHQGPGHLRLCHADGGRRRRARNCGRNWSAGCARRSAPIASPDLIQFAPGLPKTRSGKIMRRILRKIAEDDFGNLGDTTTLADPAVVDDLVNNRQNRASA